ncbi:MAG: hypothetical protein JSS82_08905 [Bacteroidetes bacterium]|nr:hypothetical protein [Bacteroidota bacterium]
MPDDPGYGCDNDLNNYSHDGSSVLNDSGSDDSGSSGFSWGDLLSSGSNGNSGNSYARSGNPYQPYMHQTNYTNAFTPQGNDTNYSSYGNNANFQKPTKPTPPTQAQNPNNPGTPVLNNQVTNNNNTTDRDVLDTGNLLGKNPLKKNVVSSDVLDARSKTFFERLQNEPLSYFPQYNPDDNLSGNSIYPDIRPQTGTFYNKSGEFLYGDGNINGKVYVVSQLPSFDDTIEGSGTITYTELKNVTADTFRTTANIVMQECKTKGINEFLYVAHTSYNEAIANNMTMYAKLMTTYSSVHDKTPLSDNNNSVIANYARAAVISTLTGDIDPTKGCRYWDGSDFLAWGLHSLNGTPHNKFEEYDEIFIPTEVYNQYLRNQQHAYPSGITYKVRNRKGEVIRSVTFSLPADVFSDQNNWTPTGFRYVTGKHHGFRIEAVVTAGLTIFWKVLPR